ncbi:MAG TPA: hypothetical protein VF158_15115 [Longimicrobiales bacterium]
MMMLLIAGSMVLVKSTALVWTWALCRAAALADRRVAAPGAAERRGRGTPATAGGASRPRPTTLAPLRGPVAVRRVSAPLEAWTTEARRLPGPR